MHTPLLEKFYPLPMIEVKPLNGVKSLTHARGCEYHKFVTGGIGSEHEAGDPMPHEKKFPMAKTMFLLGISFSFLILFLSSVSGFPAKRKSTMEIPEGSVGIIAYGSLMSLPSMEQTLGHKYAGPVHQVHLTGYERAWACLRPNNDPLANSAGIEKIDAFFLRDNERVPFIGTVQLNIHPQKKSRINCILYLITNEELLRFDKREYGYRRVDVTDKIEEFRFRGGKVYVYEGLPGRTGGSSPDEGTYILIKEFVDLVTSACDAIGKNFRGEFDKSTRPCAYQVVSFKKVIWEKAK